MGTVSIPRDRPPTTCAGVCEERTRSPGADRPRQASSCTRRTQLRPLSLWKCGARCQLQGTMTVGGRALNTEAKWEPCCRARPEPQAGGRGFLAALRWGTADRGPGHPSAGPTVARPAPRRPPPDIPSPVQTVQWFPTDLGPSVAGRTRVGFRGGWGVGKGAAFSRARGLPASEL